MENDELIKLIDKYLVGNCTPDEKRLVEDWYEHTGNNVNDIYAHDPDKIQKATQHSLLAIKKKLAADEPLTKRLHVIEAPKRWLRIAAAFLLFLSFGTLIIHRYYNAGKPQVAYKKQPDVLPGTNKAILMLGNGKKIVLNDLKVGIIAEQGLINIKKNVNNSLSYLVNERFKNAEVQQNTIYVPYGGRYNVVLADGTVVYLNAGSSLKYPTIFNGSQRVVELTGEAYFEVAKNKYKPFLVRSGGQTVAVLGTHFNVHAYTNEAAIKTTLLEGSVIISNSKGLSELLKPGQQAAFKASDASINIHDVDTDEAVAWKNGLFKFNDTDLRTVMLQLERWYNVDVKYEGNVPNSRFYGGTYMNKNLSEVLKVLELNGIHFKIEGKTIIVKP